MFANQLVIKNLNLLWLFVFTNYFQFGLVAEWAPFGGKAAHSFDLCSFFVFSICKLSYFQFRIRGQNLGSDFPIIAYIICYF